MSAKIVVCLLVCLIISGSASALYSSRYLELSSFKDELDEYGLVVFSGEVRSTHTTQPIRSVSIHVTVKKDGLIMGVARIPVGRLQPLDSTSFEHETLYTKEEYDEVYARTRGRLEEPSDDLVIGEVYIVEDSFNIVYDFPLSASLSVYSDAIFGEIRNDTNAVVSELIIYVALFDARGDKLIKIATDRSDWIHYEEIEPGETINFSMQLRPGSLPKRDKIKSWDVRLIGWTPLSIVDNAIATGVESASWGQIKAMGR